MVVFSGLTQLTKANNVLDYDSVWNCDRTKVNWYCNKPKEETPVQEVKRKLLNKLLYLILLLI